MRYQGRRCRPGSLMSWGTPVLIPPTIFERLLSMGANLIRHAKTLFDTSSQGGNPATLGQRWTEPGQETAPIAIARLEENSQSVSPHESGRICPNARVCCCTRPRNDMSFPQYQICRTPVLSIASCTPNPQPRTASNKMSIYSEL